MSQLETALTYLEQCRDEMQRLWETVVRLETPSSDPAAVDKLASHLDTYCGALGMETELYRPEGAGACLFAKTQERELSPILLLGHMGHRPSRRQLSRRRLDGAGRRRLRPRRP